jgi:hypothetical protein
MLLHTQKANIRNILHKCCALTFCLSVSNTSINPFQLHKLTTEYICCPKVNVCSNLNSRLFNVLNFQQNFESVLPFPEYSSPISSALSVQTPQTSLFPYHCNLESKSRKAT